MHIQPLFPTLVGIHQASAEQKARIHAEILQQEGLIKSLLAPSWGDNVLSSFEAEKDLFQRAGLHALQAFMQDSVLDFVRGTRREAEHLALVPELTQSWVNVTRRFGFQERHNHERLLEGLPVSGVYHFRTNGQDGNLGLFPSDAQYRLFGNHEIAPAEGQIVLFRSEVFHRVSANLTDGDRISFAFNVVLRRSGATGA